MIHIKEEHMKHYYHRTGAAVLIAVLVCFLFIFNTNVSADNQAITPEIYKSLQYRHIGPPGNRTAAVVGVPGDPLVYYIGSSSGGIFKSTDGGTTWKPVFDKQPAQSIGALAVANSDANVVWAGTGEAFIRSNISIGNGVYKSTDAGKTWKHMGLPKSGRIGRIVINTENPDIVLVAAMGHCYGPQKERGVYKTTNGGKTWKQVLFADKNTGCFEIAMNPKNPRIMFAGMWPLVIHTYGRTSGGPNGGIWKSTDGGDTWKRLKGRGLPESPIGKVGLAIAYSNPHVVYALIETGHPNRGVLWRSNNSGNTWKLVSYNRLLNERSHYASRVMVNPGDENEVYFAANSQSITLDGGYTSETVRWSGDCHDMWADPLDANRFMISDDGGAIITLNRGKTWRRISLPNAQMYHVAVDNQIPYYVYGGKQDGPAYKGLSQGIPPRSWGQSRSLWGTTAGGECGFIVPDPKDANIVWGGSYNAQLQRADYRTGHVNSVHIWPESIYGSHGAVVKYRFNWTFPIHISPHDHNVVYAGSQFVHRTSDAGKSWQVISPDLTTNDASKQGPSGGLTRDNLAVEYGCVVFAIAESPIDNGCIWAGSNDGLVHVTRDSGKTWANVTKNIPKLPVWGTVSNIEPSRYHAGTAYITVDFHQMNNRDPFVYKTTNYGKTWKSLSSTIPKSVFSYVHWVHEDPLRQGLLYLGTENAIYVSFNDGKKWLPLQNNLPHAPVHHMVIQEHFNDLVVGTYGRGFWIMDDITPLQQLNDQVLAAKAHLFKPRPAYRLHSIAGVAQFRPNATINYYLGDKPKGKVNISILDGQGKLVKKLSGSKKKGINRVNWSMRHFASPIAKLRTKPPGNPHVVEEKRFHRRWEQQGWYPILSWGTWGGFSGHLASPGTYTVELKVGEQTLTQKLTIKKDPRSTGTLADINQQDALHKKIRKELIVVSTMISQIEWMKKGLHDLKALQKEQKSFKKVKAKHAVFAKKLQAIEDELFQPMIAEGDSKSFRFPQKLYCKLSVLAGDVNDSIDFAPNQQQLAVFAKLKKGVDTQTALFKGFITKDLPEFNTFLKSLNYSGIVCPKLKTD